MFVEEKQRFRVLVGSICAYNLSLFGWWAQPEILHTLVERSGFSPSASGLVLAVELIAMALTAFLLAPFIGRVPLKAVCQVAGLIVAACHFASATAGSVELLVVLRALAGGAAGLVLAVANAVLASSPDPDRAYGLLATWNVASGVALLTAMPPLEHAYGQAGVFGLLGLACLLMCLFMRYLPATVTIERAPKVARNRRAVVALLLTAMFPLGHGDGNELAVHHSYRAKDSSRCDHRRPGCGAGRRRRLCRRGDGRTPGRALWPPQAVPVRDADPRSRNVRANARFRRRRVHYRGARGTRLCLLPAALLSGGFRRLRSGRRSARRHGGDVRLDRWIGTLARRHIGRLGRGADNRLCNARQLPVRRIRPSLDSGRPESNLIGP